MENKKRVFDKVSESDEKKLMNGLTAIWMEENIPYFDETDMSVLIQRLFEQRYDVYGIECFSREDFGYFKTYVQELYIQDYGRDINRWYIDAFNKIRCSYKELVLSSEPDNPPVFNISFGKM